MFFYNFNWFHDVFVRNSHVALAINSEQIIEVDIFQRILIKKIKFTTYKIMRVELTNQQNQNL